MNLVIPKVNLAAIFPELMVTLVALVVLLLGVFARKERGTALAFISLFGLLAAMVSAVAMWGRHVETFEGMFVVDNFSLFFHLIFLVAAVLTVLFSIHLAWPPQ